MKAKYPHIPRRLDARVRLFGNDKVTIRKFYRSGIKIGYLAKLYGVVRQTIFYTLHPDKAKEVAEKNRKLQMYKKLTKSKRNAYMRKHRKRKYLINTKEYSLWKKLTDRRHNVNKIFEYRRVERGLDKPIHVVSYAKIRSSSKDKKVIYMIARYNNKKMFCSCPQFIFRQPGKCKHIKAFLEYERILRLKGK